MFQSVYRHELKTKLSQIPWKQEIAKIPDWPRRKAVAEFRLCVEHSLSLSLKRLRGGGPRGGLLYWGTRNMRFLRDMQMPCKQASLSTGEAGGGSFAGTFERNE